MVSALYPRNSIDRPGWAKRRRQPGGWATERDDDEDSQNKPRLRRAGSSTASASTLVGDDDDSLAPHLHSEHFDPDYPTASTHHLVPSHDESASSLRSSWSDSLSETATLQVNGVTEGFRKSGLPWSGPECRSWIAGGSGILYCLPACFCTNNHLEQGAWILQAVFSVMADYVCVDRDSIFHGLDRCYATYNVLAMVCRALVRLHLHGVIVATITPLSCFVMANRAKQRLDLRAWHYWHGAWHVTGAAVVSFIVHLLYSCPSASSTTSAVPMTDIAVTCWFHFCREY
jgi:hypothetical protein